MSTLIGSMAGAAYPYLFGGTLLSFEAGNVSLARDGVDSGVVRSFKPDIFYLVDVERAVAMTNGADRSRPIYQIPPFEYALASAQIYKDRPDELQRAADILAERIPINDTRIGAQVRMMAQMRLADMFEMVAKQRQGDDAKNAWFARGRAFQSADRAFGNSETCSVYYLTMGEAFELGGDHRAAALSFEQALDVIKGEGLSDQYLMAYYAELSALAARNLLLIGDRHGAANHASMARTSLGQFRRYDERNGHLFRFADRANNVLAEIGI